MGKKKQKQQNDLGSSRGAQARPAASGTQHHPASSPLPGQGPPQLSFTNPRAGGAD